LQILKETLEVYSLLSLIPDFGPGEAEGESAEPLERMRKARGLLQERIETLRAEVTGGREELERLRGPSQKQAEQVKELKRRVGALEKEKVALVEETRR
jgi:predicted nuclease with TOPRIM domain